MIPPSIYKCLNLGRLNVSNSCEGSFDEVIVFDKLIGFLILFVVRTIFFFLYMTNRQILELFSRHFYQRCGHLLTLRM